MIADKDDKADKGGNGKPDPIKLTVTRRGPGNPAWHKDGHGVSGNPRGAPRAKTQLHRYICMFIEMTPDELNKYIHNPTQTLTLCKRGALKVAKKVAEGDYQIIKDIVERDEGKVPLTIQMNISPISNQIAAMDESQVNERFMEVARMMSEQKMLAEGEGDNDGKE